MTISSSTRKAGPFAGDGLTTEFAFAFKVFSAADLYVVKADASTGAEWGLTLNADYTVSLNSDQDNSPGGTVLLNSALGADYTLTLASRVSYTQNLTLTNQGAFYPAVINSALDRLTILTQQLNEQVQRCVRVPISSPDGSVPTAQQLIAAAHVGLGNVDNYATATQAEAEAGSANDKFMTPLRTKQAVDKLAMPSGCVAHFAMTSAPTGWLKCNGAAVSRTTYADLFAAIGTTFGAGDGSTTFNLPDLRGEFVRGWDDSRGVDSGRTFGSAQADDFKAHGHRVFDGAGGSTAGSYPAVLGDTYEGTGANNGTANAGGTETRPRNIALLACIKY